MIYLFHTERKRTRSEDKTPLIILIRYLKRNKGRPLKITARKFEPIRSNDVLDNNRDAFRSVGHF